MNFFVCSFVCRIPRRTIQGFTWLIPSAMQAILNPLNRGETVGDYSVLSCFFPHNNCVSSVHIIFAFHFRTMNVRACAYFHFLPDKYPVGSKQCSLFTNHLERKRIHRNPFTSELARQTNLFTIQFAAQTNVFTIHWLVLTYKMLRFHTTSSHTVVSSKMAEKTSPLKSLSVRDDSEGKRALHIKQKEKKICVHSKLSFSASSFCGISSMFFKVQWLFAGRSSQGWHQYVSINIHSIFYGKWH